jgi:hypothetical protein
LLTPLASRRLFLQQRRRAREELVEAGSYASNGRIVTLVVTPEGLPLTYEVLAGNTSDKTTLRAFSIRPQRCWRRPVIITRGELGTVRRHCDCSPLRRPADMNAGKATPTTGDIGIETVSPHSAAASLARRASASLPSWLVNDTWRASLSPRRVHFKVHLPLSQTPRLRIIQYES